MEVKIFTYTHGDEHPPEEWANVPSIVANPRAKERGVRFIDADLNRSFKSTSMEYEPKRARELLPIIDEADVVIDIHRTTAPYAKFTAIITKEEDAVCALPFAPEAIVLMKDAAYSLIGNAKAGVVLEYPEHYTYSESPTLYRMIDYVPAQKGWKDFHMQKYNNQYVYPYLVGEKAYNGNCFILEKV